MDVPDRAADIALAYDGSAAVVAHGLLNQMTVISGAAELLRQEWDKISAPRRAELLSMIQVQAADASQALVGIMQGLSPDALDMLDELSRRRDEAAVERAPRLRRRRSDKAGSG